MRYIDVAVPKFGDDQAPNMPSVPVVANRALPSFRARAIEEYNLDDTRSIRTADDTEDQDESKDDGSSIDDKGGDQFYDTQDEIADVSIVPELDLTSD